PLSGADLPAPRLHRAVELSVIMPTYNRGAMMQATVERYVRAADRLGAEVIVIDDGSRDDTPDRLRTLNNSLPRLVTERVANGGPAHARNLGAAMARGRILVFVGDDVRPVDDDFLSIHAAAHAKMPAVGHAVLGKITWPNADAMPVNFVMSHIQGDGEQQFGYRSMTGYQWYDWRLFYSSNVSVKKALVPDWMTGGYDRSFHLAAFEDPEFALRTSLRLQEAKMPFGVFYVPAAQLEHHHHYTTAGFIARQVSVGMMAQRFLELHPGRAADLGLDGLVAQLALPLQDTPFPVEHYFAVFEGLKSWALVIEHHYGLGHKNWHGDLLRAVFQLAFFEGFLRVQSGAAVNVAAGCRHVLEAVRTKLNRAIASEILGEIPGFELV
ncbi:MAG: glycosyltransferase, partial [Gemmatimonadaceae bacterium]|nr:glycosyltransferase [Acetobacteraceae bacterium]